ncbi:MAG: alanine--tRNA ligase, partial [Candidatus Aminicenantes bacterium]|nr:alanine--tRNA ligase [Candidatus Aminicenantes bacterium]
VSEAGIAAGMRRIEAVTGEGAVRYLRELEDELAGLEKALGVGRRDLPARIEKMAARTEELEKEIRELRRDKLAGAEARATLIRTVKGMAVEVRRLDGLSMAELRDKADELKSKLGSGVVVIGSASEGRALIVASVTKDLTGRVQAGALIKELAPVIGGGGGGRPDFAQSGGSGAAELDKALDLVPGLVERLAA